jgi:hypothetical protein
MKPDNLWEYLMCLHDGYVYFTIEENDLFGEDLLILQYKVRWAFDQFVESIPRGEVSGGDVISVADHIMDIGHSDMVVHIRKGE